MKYSKAIFSILLVFIIAIVNGAPIYETPEIVKADSVSNLLIFIASRRALRQENFKFKPKLKRKSKHKFKNKEALDKQNAEKNTARNELVRGFSLGKGKHYFNLNSH